LFELRNKMPVVALADGYVFGAGAGLFMAASHRIATPRVSFAMPECILGIVPDCGATDFLATHLPGHLDRWAVLTGARLSTAQMAATGLCTHVCEADAAVIKTLRHRLLSCSVDAPGGAATSDELSECLTKQAALCEAMGWAEQDHLTALTAAANRVFGFGRIPSVGIMPLCWERGCRLLEQLDSKLEEETRLAAIAGDELVGTWASEARAKLARASPAALLVAYEASQLVLPNDPKLRRTKALGIELAANEALCVRLDFDEGVACAVGSRKGQSPRWEHESVQAAAADPAVEALLNAVRRARPMDAAKPLLGPAGAAGRDRTTQRRRAPERTSLPTFQQAIDAAQAACDATRLGSY